MAASMMQGFQAVSGAAVTAVCSPTSGRASQFADSHAIAAHYDAYDAMLADEQIAAVYIANRTSGHAAASIAALNAGKHVLCEKPFAMTGDEGADVIAAAESAGRLFMEGFWTLCLPSYQRVFDLVSQQSFGAAAHLTAAYGYPASPTLHPRLYDPEDGGVLLDLGGYPIALALKLFGAIESFDADVSRNENGIDTHLNLQTRHQSGEGAQLAASFVSMTSNAAFVSCAEGAIAIPAPLFGGEKVQWERFAHADNADNSGLKSMLKKAPLARRLKAGLPPAGEYHGYGANQYQPQLQHFIHLIAAKKLQSDIVPHALSLSVLRLVDRIRAAEKT